MNGANTGKLVMSPQEARIFHNVITLRLPDSYRERAGEDDCMKPLDTVKKD